MLQEQIKEGKTMKSPTDYVAEVHNMTLEQLQDDLSFYLDKFCKARQRKYEDYYLLMSRIARQEIRYRRSKNNETSSIY